MSLPLSTSTFVRLSVLAALTTSSKASRGNTAGSLSTISRPPKKFWISLQIKKGTKAALQEYAELKKTSANSFDFTADDLNQMGYALLNQKKFDEAIDVLKLNVEMYPNSGNVYDSLGEAYMHAGQTDLAIQNYEKSLQLDPENENAVTMLKRLRDQK
jgi:tetratricopeptide (TPR) repeat protein